MSTRENKELELKIINLTEKIINIALEIELISENEKKEYFLKGANLVKELSNEIILLINDESHLENMLYQLISQKLPEDNLLMTSDGFYKKDLQEIISKGLELYETSKKDQSKRLPPAEHLNNINGNISKLHQNLKSIFPKEKVLTNYLFRGKILQYYIPEKKLVLEEIPSEEGDLKYRGIKDYWCQKNGLIMLKITFQESKNKFQLLKKLKYI